MALPDGYTQYEYIESSGSQYIDTGFRPNQNTAAYSDAQFISAASYPTIFGARNQNAQMFWFYNNGNSSVSTTFVAKINTTEYRLNGNFYDRQIFSVDAGTVQTGTSTINVTMGNFQSVYSLFLFGTNNRGTLQYPSNLRLYSCQIYDNGTLIRDYVPCANPSGEVGLYDQANGVFYGNAGTGTFSHGAVVITTPPAPQNLRQTGKTLESISLAWDAVSSADGYKLYRDGALIATQTATSYTDTGLLPSESHAYQVLAYNGEGDGALSKAITMSTEQAYYVITPVFTSAHFAQNPTTINTPILLSVAVSDEMVFLQPENLQSGEIYSGEAS